jgi:hypothetical protein
MRDFGLYEGGDYCTYLIFHIQCLDIKHAIGFQDMDLYDDSRTLVHSGPLARRQRSETDWHGWNDLSVALLDNYCKFSSRLSMSVIQMLTSTLTSHNDQGGSPSE